MTLFNLVISKIFCTVILIMQNKPYSCHSIRIKYSVLITFRFWSNNILIYLHNESFFFPNIIPCAFKSDQVTFFYFSYIAQALPSSSINWLPRNQYGHMIYCLVIGWACCIKVKSTHGRGPLDLYGNMILDGKNIKPYVTGFYIFSSMYIVWNVNQNISIHI